MGLLDVASPLLASLDSVLGFLPAAARIAVWALLSSAITMGVYFLLSNQEKISRAKERARSARQAMQSYDGDDFDEMMPLAMESLKASFSHLGIVTLPAIGGSLPVLLILIFISGAYGYIAPVPGDTVRMNTTLALEATAGETDNTYEITWPESAGAELRIAGQSEVVSLPEHTAVPVIHQRLWWNSLIGNPNGYLPDSWPPGEIRIELAPQEILGFGPGWMRGWEALYFLLLIGGSLAIKIGFRID